MQLEALQVFCDIVRYRSFSQAAAAHQPRLSQSAVSQIVHQLENRLGVQLINRSTRPLQLTALGLDFYRGCKDLVERYLALEASIKQGPLPQTAPVPVAAIYSVGLGDMAGYVERFQRDQPFARVHVEYLHSNRVVERVRDGSVDLGLVSFPAKSPDLVTLPWREEEMVLVCPPGHPLARLTAVRPDQLQGARYIAFDRELGIRRQVDRFLRRHRVAVEVALEFDNIENIKKGITEAGGVALLPKPTLRQEVESGLLVARPLIEARFVRPLAIIHRRRPLPGPLARSFINLLLDHGGPDSNGHSNGTTHGRNGPRKKK